MGDALWIYPKSTWLLPETKRVSVFVKFLISPFLCYLLDTPTNKYRGVCDPMINHMDRFQDFQKSPCKPRGMSKSY